MGFSFRKSFGLGKGARVNVSKRGVSASKRVGRVTVNSRGKIAVRILPGITWRSK